MKRKTAAALKATDDFSFYLFKWRAKADGAFHIFETPVEAMTRVGVVDLLHSSESIEEIHEINLAEGWVQNVSEDVAAAYLEKHGHDFDPWSVTPDFTNPVLLTAWTDYALSTRQYAGAAE